MKPEQDPTGDPADFLRDTELAKRIGISAITLRHWRLRGEGPPYYKLGSRVLYKWSAVEEWLETRKVGKVG